MNRVANGVFVACAITAPACKHSSSDCDAIAELVMRAPPQASAAAVKVILAQRCALGGCHLHAPGAAGLVLDVSSDSWTSALVGVPALESPSMDRVAAGDPDRSWLVYKIIGSFCGAACDPTLGCGAEMPFGTALAAADQETIVAWVVAGAPSR